MPLTPATFAAGSQREHANVRKLWLANLLPNFNVPGQSYMSSASSAAIESATVSLTYVYAVARI